jgi:lipid-A-disaccharide synthase
MCLFPFEPEYFEPYGLSAEYVGHPLIRQDHEKDARAFKQLYNIGEDDFVFGMYLGSREAEIQKHSEVFLEAANFLLEQNPDLQIVIPTLPDMEFDVFKAIEGLRVAPVVVSDQKKKWDAMRSCDLAMAVSGTVGLELAYMNVPHIIAYKTHPITAIIVRLLAKVKFVHLANIMVDKLIVPEFLQGRCQPLPIALELAKFLKNKDVIEEQKKSFEGVRRVLKGKMATDPADAAAQFVLGKLYSN